MRTQRQSDLALRFFGLAGAVVAIAGGLAYGLIRLSSLSGRSISASFPAAFGISTLLLLAGSLCLHRALREVRNEKQRLFRRLLVLALTAGTLFVGVQSYGLWCLVHRPDAAQVATGVTAFVFVLTVLHGMHFTVALIFLVYVTLRGLSDRYDHEYYWGVTVCAYFWHVLGVAWFAILAVFAITS